MCRAESQHQIELLWAKSVDCKIGGGREDKRREKYSTKVLEMGLLRSNK